MYISLNVHWCAVIVKGLIFDTQLTQMNLQIILVSAILYIYITIYIYTHKTNFLTFVNRFMLNYSHSMLKDGSSFQFLIYKTDTL